MLRGMADNHERIGHGFLALEARVYLFARRLTHVEQAARGRVVDGVRTTSDARADLVPGRAETHLYVREAVRRHNRLDAADDDHLDNLCGNKSVRRVQALGRWRGGRAMIQHERAVKS